MMMSEPMSPESAEVEPNKPRARIRYMGGYRYQLIENYSVNTKIYGQRVESEYLWLHPDGLLAIEAGYCWDGASGPAVDSSTIMRGSLIHDALYQLIRMELMPKVLRKMCDQELYLTCREDGMSWVRAHYVYYAVRLFGRSSADAASRRVVQEAP